MNEERRKNRPTHRAIIPEFPNDVVKKLAALIGLRAKDKIHALHRDLNEVLDSARRFESENPDLMASDRAAKDYSATLAGVFDWLRSRSMTAFRLHRAYRHPGGTPGFDADMKAIERVAKTLGEVAPKRGRKQIYPAFHQVARSLARLYEKYHKRPPFSYAGKKKDGLFIETTPGEKFVGPALEVIFPGITPTEKSTAMKGKNL